MAEQSTSSESADITPTEQQSLQEHEYSNLAAAVDSLNLAKMDASTRRAVGIDDELFRRMRAPSDLERGRAYFEWRKRFVDGTSPSEVDQTL